MDDKNRPDFHRRTTFRDKFKEILRFIPFYNNKKRKNRMPTDLTVRKFGNNLLKIVNLVIDQDINRLLKLFNLVIDQDRI